MNSAKNNYNPILLVDDEPEILELTKMTLGCEGMQNVLTIQDSRQLVPLLGEQNVSVVVLDLMMPHLSGIDLLPVLVSDFPDIPVIIMTAADDLETAVECLKNGAFDYLLKPVEPNRLVSTIDKAVRLNSLRHEVSSLKECLLSDRLDHTDAFAGIITASKKMRAVFQYAEVIARSRQPILITGETGVGKELMARAIHTLSEVKGEFVSVNVAGLDDIMFSDTLFGHKRGAFTGADKQREGLISKSSGGTLFLDEIGDLNQHSQVKLLRLLQGDEYYPLGSDVMKSSDARIVLATNQNLQHLLAMKKFRKDLYYRLCTYQVNIPPLRDRMEDLPFLLDHFVAEAALSLGKVKPVISSDVPVFLAQYNFPGNIREFKALVSDAVARHKNGLLSLQHFSGLTSLLRLESVEIREADVKYDNDPLSAIFGKFPTLTEVEEYVIEIALKVAGGKQSVAASLLGITRQGLYKKMRVNRHG